MILEVRYKGQKINPNDIKIDFTTFWGEKLTGSIEEYGADQWNSAWAECEAGESW